MRNKIFLNRQVSEIIGITPRQVLSWTEKGLVIPFKESTGAGTKRGYDYTNLLEFGLCEVLFFMGIGFRAVKKLTSYLRNDGSIEEWAKDFPRYRKRSFERSKQTLRELVKEHPENQTLYLKLKEIEEASIDSYIPKKPTGVLVYFLGKEFEDAFIIAWDMDLVLNLSMVKQGFLENYGGILVNLGRIKKAIDRKL